MTAAARLIGAACVLATVGCGGGQTAAPPPSSCFAGDATSAPAVTLVHQMGGALAPVSDGDALPLVVAPQGGEVLVVGVRATNIDGCSVTLSTSMIVPSTGAVAAFERRPVTLQLAADGWFEPKNPTGLADFANVPACPIAGLEQAVDGEPYLLTVQVDDFAGRHGQASATVVPSCGTAANAAICRCQCGAGYVLGSRCP